MAHSDGVVRQPWGLGPADLNPASLIRRTIAGVDAHLSRRAEVQTYSEDPRCMLRVAATQAMRPVTLSDGSQIRPGDTVLDVHCWNERVPPMPKGGPDLAWAMKTSGRLKHSLRLLAQAMEVRPDLAAAAAVRARVNFVGAGGSNASVSRIIERMGFEDVDEGRPGAVGAFHDALENVLIGALVWTHNPEALRRDKLIRERRPVWSSTARLRSLHGADRHAP